MFHCVFLLIKMLVFWFNLLVSCVSYVIDEFFLVFYSFLLVKILNVVYFEFY